MPFSFSEGAFRTFTDVMKRHLFILSFLFFGCAEEAPQPDPLDGILGASEQGVFRGSDIGDSQNDVLDREAEHVVYNMPDELTCRIPVTLKDSTFYDITYNFDETGLYVIALDIFPSSEEVSGSLFDDFKKHYDLRFGATSEDDGFTMWNARSAKGTNIEITMIDEGREAGRPYISVVFLETNAE